MRIQTQQDDEVEIGFAPLIDCIFLLLIFFLVATTFNKQEANKKHLEVPVDLPSSSASFNWPLAGPEPLVLGVDAAGQFYIGPKAVSVNELRERLKQEKAANPDRRIRIDGDRLAPYQHIVHLLDLCQFEGLTNIGMHARK